MQWSKVEDTKGVIRKRQSKDGQCNGEKCEDTKTVIRCRKSKKGRQQNDQKKKDKRTNNDLQNITQKTNEPH